MIQSSEGEQLEGHQRPIDDKHAEDIKKYLETSGYRFFPEVILSVRTETNEVLWVSEPVGIESNGSDGILIKRRFISKNVPIHEVKIDINKLDEIRNEKRIRRIDGNHRLWLAEQLRDDPMLPNKYLAPFCAIIMKPPGDIDEDLAESQIFHTINSTAMPLDSEHALKLILGTLGNQDEEFKANPALNLTRLLRDNINQLPRRQKERLGPQPLTVLSEASKAFIQMDSNIASSRDELNKFSKMFISALNDILARLPADCPSLAESEFFLELVARVWKRSIGKKRDERVNNTVEALKELNAWLGRDGLEKLSRKKSLSEQLLETFHTIRSRVPKRIFLARWYPKSSDGEEKHKADLRLQQVKRALDDLRQEGIELELDDPGTQKGGTFPIHNHLYAALQANDIIMVDLTGCRPNVCVEAGYALRHHEKNRLLFIFQPNTQFTSIPFDLSTFRYEKISEAAEIPDLIKPHIREIVEIASEIQLQY